MPGRAGRPDRRAIVAQQESDLGFADSGSVSVALAALLDEQAASPLSEWSDGDFDGAAMAAEATKKSSRENLRKRLQRQKKKAVDFG